MGTHPARIAGHQRGPCLPLDEVNHGIRLIVTGNTVDEMVR